MTLTGYQARLFFVFNCKKHLSHVPVMYIYSRRTKGDVDVARKSKNKKSFHLRIDPTIIENTAIKAEKQGVDTSAYIEQLCRKDQES